MRRFPGGDANRGYATRDGGSARRYRTDGRTYTRNGDGNSTRYKPSGPIVQRDRGYSSQGGSRRGYSGGGYVRHSPRRYYVGDFYRPRYAVRSGFFLGLSIGSFPSYAYRYYDPYCGTYYSGLGPYYDHCHGLGHPSAILVIDYRSSAPIATCIYDGGDWVVDDCAGDEGYANEDDGYYYDDGYDE